MPSALPPNQQQGNLTNTSVQQTPQQSQAQVPPPTDFLGKIGTAGPPWAHGIAIIITAFVTLFSVLKIDFGQIISNYISDSNTVTAQTVQNNKTVIDSLSSALQQQSDQIATLRAQNESLRTEVLRLQLLVEQLQRECNITLITTPTPTSPSSLSRPPPMFTPVPTLPGSG